MTGSKTIRAGALAAAFALMACLGDFRLSASNLQIAPNPAVPGDEVVASFILMLTPLQRHTVIVMINDTEHHRLTSTEDAPLPFLIPLGDAADLIAQYGAGTHTAYIEVRAEDANETARTQSVGFELRTDTP